MPENRRGDLNEMINNISWLLKEKPTIAYNNNLNDKKTNRYFEKFKYLMTKKRVLLPFTALITMSTVVFLRAIYLEKPIQFALNLFNAHQRINAFNIIGGAACIFLVFSVFLELIQSIRVKEHKITERAHKDVLNEVLNKITKDRNTPNINLKNLKDVKYIMVEQSNGTRSYFYSDRIKAPVKESCIIDMTHMLTSRLKNFFVAIGNRRKLVPTAFTALVFMNVTILTVNAISYGLGFQEALHTLLNPVSLTLSAILTITLAIGIINNIYDTKFTHAVYQFDGELGHREHNEKLINFIENKLSEEDIKQPGSKITRVHVECNNCSERLFINN